MESRYTYRTAVFYRNYFVRFFGNMSKRIKARIMWAIQLVEEVQKIPKIYFSHMKGSVGLYEIKVKAGKDIFRIFSFFWRVWRVSDY